MSTNFPTDLDTLTNPVATDKQSVVPHATQHSDSNDAIEAIEGKVGVTGSVVTSSLDYLTKVSTDPGHTHTFFTSATIPNLSVPVLLLANTLTASGILSAPTINIPVLLSANVIDASGNINAPNIYASTLLSANEVTASGGITTPEDIEIIADSKSLKLGTAGDASLTFDGNSLEIVANVVTAGDDMNLIADNITLDAATTATINGAGYPSIYMKRGGANLLTLAGTISWDQLVFILYDDVGNDIIIANSSGTWSNFDHGLQTDPTLFIHSDTSPDTNNTQWMSLHHDKTDANINTGTGDINITPVSTGSVVLGDGGTTHFLSVDSSGVVSLNGNARVWVSDDLPVQAVKIPAANYPANDNIDNFGFHRYDAGTEESVYYTWVVPLDFAEGTGSLRGHYAFVVESPPDGTGDLNVRMGFEYKGITKGDVFTFATDTSTGYIDETIEDDETAFEMHITIDGVCDTTNWQPHDKILFRFYRDATADEDTYDADVWIKNYHLEYLSNKLGEPS